jgi:sulfopyruvate decarboxylase TPP-binding subunit
VVLMQQSGVGNSLNAYFSLVAAYDIHLKILVIDRGTSDENPVQRVSSARTSAVLRTIGCGELSLEDETCEDGLLDFLVNSSGWLLISENNSK